MISRRQAREEALQILYASEITGDSIGEVLKEPTAIHEDGAPFSLFTVKLTEDSVKTVEESDSLIESYAHNWSLNRIALIDRLIFRLAITEFLYFPDIPPKVTIDEAVELAKKFSTERSGRFINGMLDSILTHLTDKRRILKNNGITGTGTVKQKRAQKK
ncbi:transcription antitermination factor NusB [candidate division KSB1 bacterium]